MDRAVQAAPTIGSRSWREADQLLQESLALNASRQWQILLETRALAQLEFDRHLERLRQEMADRERGESSELEVAVRESAHRVAVSLEALHARMQAEDAASSARLRAEAESLRTRVEAKRAALVGTVKELVVMGAMMAVTAGAGAPAAGGGAAATGATGSSAGSTAAVAAAGATARTVQARTGTAQPSRTVATIAAASGGGSKMVQPASIQSGTIVIDTNKKMEQYRNTVYDRKPAQMLPSGSEIVQRETHAFQSDVVRAIASNVFGFLQPALAQSLSIGFSYATSNPNVFSPPAIPAPTQK
jgi:hypothetical protein